MKKLVAVVLYACALTGAYTQDIRAQSGAGTSVTTSSSATTPNLISSGTNHTWTGVITNPTAVPGGFSGGNQPAYNPNTNTLLFGYTQSTVAQTYAINQALQGSGIQVGGYNYSWSYLNDSNTGGTLSSTIRLTSPTGSTLESYSYAMNTIAEGWRTMSGTQNFNQQYGLASVGSLNISFTGKDSRFWAGYYGPQVKDVNLSLNYVAAPITTHTMGDDGWVNVPLQFGFPFYGKVFTNSFMFDNGVVGFFDPVAGGCNPANGYCGGQQWNAQPFSNSMSNQFSYMIAPLWADIAPIPGTTTYQTQGDATYQRYMWNNVAEYYSAYGSTPRLNTFGLEIRPSGFIGASYGNINLQTSSIGIGTIGNPALGEYNQIAFHPYGTQLTSVPNWSLNNTPDACSANPLASPSCPGYTDAMCTVNPLYAQSCPGYAQAYFTQQCSANPLYNASCPGYAVAYLNYQCSINPLYSTTCEGYETAYKTQQCSLNPLYATDCPGYAQAYFDQQCSLNGLYSQQCPNYAEAYAKKMLLEQQNIAGTVATAGVVASTAPTTTTTTSAESITTQASSGISDTTVSAVVTTKSTATSSDTQPAAAVKLTAPAPAPVQQVAQAEPKKDNGPGEKREDKKDEGSKPNAGNNNNSGDNNKPSDGPKTTRQELAERKREAAQKEAISKGKELANEMGKAADLETQKAVQNVVIQAMGFTPGFDAYKLIAVPDALGYRPYEIYKGQRNVDNPAGRRFLTGSDRLHTEMVDQQYNKEK